MPFQEGETAIMKQLLLLLLFVGLCIVFFIAFKKCSGQNATDTETFADYNMLYGEISSSTDKNYYAVPEYRKPYNWPIGIYTEHPVPHISPLKYGI